MVDPLPPATKQRLAALPYSYNFVGATSGRLPDGYHHLRVTRTIGHGPEVFRVAAQRILSWGMHERAGLHVSADGPVTEGMDAIVTIPLPRYPLTAPVRVLTVVDEPSRAGFTYGTLPGHPEYGEEAFTVEQQADGRVVATVTAFSRPATWYLRLAGPLGWLAQRLAANRYLDALRG